MLEVNTSGSLYILNNNSMKHIKYAYLWKLCEEGTGGLDHSLVTCSVKDQTVIL